VNRIELRGKEEAAVEAAFVKEGQVRR